MAETAKTEPVQILPEANVVKIGGQSFIDCGRKAVFPLLEEVVDNPPRHKSIEYRKNKRAIASTQRLSGVGYRPLLNESVGD